MKNIIRIIILSVLLGGLYYPSSAQQPVEKPTGSAPSAPESSHSIYIPFISKSAPATIDLSFFVIPEDGFDGILVTQGTQSYKHDVPLVTNRPTVVRVMTKTDDSFPTPNIRVSLSAYRSGNLLAGSPLVSNPGEVPVTPTRSDISKTFNFVIPSSWLSGQVTFQAIIDSNNNLNETNENNNNTSFTISFTNVPAVDLKIVPINYFHDLGSSYKLYPAPTQDHMSDDLMDLFPISSVSASLHSPYNFYGYLHSENEWIRLLDEITDLKQSSQAPSSQVWYGAIPIEGGTSWWNGGIAGLGWLGYRASIGLYDSDDSRINSGNIAAHEVGHNFGREHAPCGVSPSDPYYPYSNGQIGQYGFNVSQFTPILYTVKDFMSYCDPNWISDYTYEGLMNDQIAYGFSQAENQSQQVLMVRAPMNQGEGADILPIYEFEGVPTKADDSSGFIVELLDENGVVLSSQPVPLLRAEEPGVSYESIRAVVPKPQGSVTSVRIVKDTAPLLERDVHVPLSNAFPAEPQASPGVTLEADGYFLNWDYPQFPALVRYKSNQSDQWTALAIDVTGGKLQIFPGYLPQGELEFEITLGSIDLPAIHVTWINNTVQ